MHFSVLGVPAHSTDRGSRFVTVERISVAGSSALGSWLQEKSERRSDLASPGAASRPPADGERGFAAPQRSPRGSRALQCTLDTCGEMRVFKVCLTFICKIFTIRMHVHEGKTKTEIKRDRSQASMMWQLCRSSKACSHAGSRQAGGGWLRCVRAWASLPC